MRFLGNLERLVASCERTGALNAVGRDVLGKAVRRRLRNLEALDAYVEAHPDVSATPLEAPVVVTGLPRTGTTLLHNLLALDPAHRVLRVWEALHPIPPGEHGPTVAELRGGAERWLARFYQLVPGFEAIHRATADGPEECDALLQHTFASQHFDDMFRAQEYSDWLATAPLGEEYAHYALQLRVLSTSSPTGTNWALKSPSHLGHLDALLDALPGACVVVCHRDPAEAVASYASLVHTLRRAYSDEASAHDAGRHALTRTATAMGRAFEVRHARPNATFVDVSYRTLVEDTVAPVREIYERLGRPLDEDRVRGWVRDHPQNKHGRHDYDLARFGLTPADVEAAFAGVHSRS